MTVKFLRTRPVTAGRFLSWRLLPLATMIVALLESAWVAYPGVRARALSLEDTAAARGHRLAASVGCFSCHGPGGVGGIHNPGSEEGQVPAFGEQTQMMYVKTADDLREYILDGAPRRKREDPDYRERVVAAALHMPAYRGMLREAEVEDLVAFLRATSGRILPDSDREARGAELADELSCFACHGALGAGGTPNPGSFKGYIPSFWGADFDELVRDDDELRAWIADGAISRIAEHPIGRHFFRGQAIKMPAYGRFRSPDDIEALVAYVRWLRAGSWRPGSPAQVLLADVQVRPGSLLAALGEAALQVGHDVVQTLFGATRDDRLAARQPETAMR